MKEKVDIKSIIFKRVMVICTYENRKIDEVTKSLLEKLNEEQMILFLQFSTLLGLKELNEKYAIIDYCVEFFKTLN